MDPQQPVIVFHAKHEMESQLARDILASQGIPVLHVPGLSTGLFAIRHDLRVAVPSSAAEDAVTVLREEGLEAGIEARARGAGAVVEAVDESIPRPLRKVLLVALLGSWVVGILVLILALGKG